MVSEQVRHKPSCTATEDSRKLKFWIEDEMLFFPSCDNKGADPRSFFVCVSLFSPIQIVGFLMRRLNYISFCVSFEVFIILKEGYYKSI